MSLGEFGGTVIAELRLDEISVVVGIVQTGDEGLV